MRNFFHKAKNLSHDELSTLAKFSGGLAVLVLAVLLFSDNTTLLNLSRSANTAAVVQYSTSGTYTYTVPAGITQIWVTVVGAGGGGASSIQSGGCGDFGGGAGGGSGGFVYNQAVSVTPGQPFTVVVGKGGVGGAAPPTCSGQMNNGVAGGGSSFGNITATGGGGGIGYSAGGTGGSPSGVNGGNGEYYSCGPNAGGINQLGYGSGGSGPNYNCYGGGASGQDGYVFINPSSVAISASPQSVASGGSSVLSRSVESMNAGSCTIKDQNNNTIVSASGNTTTRIYLTSGSSWTVPSDWNSSDNTIEVIGGGGSGGAIVYGTTLSNTTGGGGGAYSEISDVALSPGAVLHYQIGAGGAAASLSATYVTLNGNAGGDTWFNGSGTTCSTQSVCAKGGGGGVASGTGTVAGAMGGQATSGIGATKLSGGNSGASNGASFATVSTGGGGAGGSNGSGNNSANDASGATGSAGGAGDVGRGGLSGTGGSYSSGGSGGNGAEWDSTHGSGGGGGGGSCIGNVNPCLGGAGGGYGAGGGGASAGDRSTGAVATSGAGSQGIIVITYLGTATTPVGPITQNTTYTLQCTNLNGALVSASTTVNVNAPTLSLTAADQNGNPASGTVTLNSTTTTTVAWSSTGANASSCSVQKYNSTTNSTSTISTGTSSSTWSDGPFTNGGSRRFTFACNDTGGNPITPAITTINVTVADICTDITGDQATAPTGCQTPNPVPGLCVPPGGTYNGSQCVVNSLPSIVSFTAARVQKGNPSTLSWNITGMMAGFSCNIQPTPVSGQPVWNNDTPWYGTATTKAISQVTAFTLTCGNGTASSTATANASLVPTVQEI